MIGNSLNKYLYLFFDESGLSELLSLISVRFLGKKRKQLRPVRKVSQWYFQHTWEESVLLRYASFETDLDSADKYHERIADVLGDCDGEGWMGNSKVRVEDK